MNSNYDPDSDLTQLTLDTSSGSIYADFLKGKRLIKQWYLLAIWTREAYEETSPTSILVASSKEALQKRFHNYLKLHCDDDSCMESIDILLTSNELMEDVAPELDCAYVLKQYVDKEYNM